jgi:hypothetical protein
MCRGYFNCEFQLQAYKYIYSLTTLWTMSDSGDPKLNEIKPQLSKTLQSGREGKHFSKQLCGCVTYCFMDRWWPGNKKAEKKGESSLLYLALGHPEVGSICWSRALMQRSWVESQSGPGGGPSPLSTWYQADSKAQKKPAAARAIPLSLTEWQSIVSPEIRKIKCLFPTDINYIIEVLQ